MTRHPDPERLQEYLADLLCREERAELEAHLAACADCTAEVVAERELRRALAGLPRSIAPERDLLAGINAAIDASVEARPRPRPGRLPSLPARFTTIPRFALATAAVVLIALTALVTTLLVRRPEGAQVAGTLPAASRDPVVREVLATEPSYRTAIAELEAALAANPALDSATAQVVRRNLAVIDRALAEAGAALQQQPDNPTLAHLLRHARAQKLELLRAATRGRT